jgi:hypothetical protein
MGISCFICVGMHAGCFRGSWCCTEERFLVQLWRDKVSLDQIVATLALSYVYASSFQNELVWRTYDLGGIW